VCWEDNHKKGQKAGQDHPNNEFRQEVIGKEGEVLDGLGLVLLKSKLRHPMKANQGEMTHKEERNGHGEQGDVKDHTFAKAQAHRSKITGTSQSGPDAAGLKKTSLGNRLLSEFFRWAKQRNITVVGTLPTIFKDVQ